MFLAPKRMSVSLLNTLAWMLLTGAREKWYSGVLIQVIHSLEKGMNYHTTCSNLTQSKHEVFFKLYISIIPIKFVNYDLS